LPSPALAAGWARRPRCCSPSAAPRSSSLVALAQERFGGLDVIINNAGIGPISAMDALRVEDWDAMIDVDLRGTLYGIAAALPVFRAQESGQIVNVLSTAGIKIVPLQGVYAGTKNAVRTISEALCHEAGPHLRVTVVSPGMVRTDSRPPRGPVVTRRGCRGRIPFHAR
jgi:NADP-dependent 3-hydroxy acid dehydrogenase YdfG